METLRPLGVVLPVPLVFHGAFLREVVWPIAGLG